MSRNFELLRRANWGEEYLEGIPTPTPSRRSPIAKRPNPARPTDRISALVQKLFLGSGTSQIRCVVFLGCVESGGEHRFARAQRRHWRSKWRSASVWWTQSLRARRSTGFWEGNLVGLSDAVDHSRGGENFAKQVEDTNLWILPAGARIKSAVGAFHSAAC